MNKTVVKLSIIVILLLTIIGCSRKKNTFVSRNIHAVTTEYNILYNGNLALQQGIEQIESNYKDNYWDVLPVERFKVEVDNRILPGQQQQVDPNFERAEEKAVKAVQKHSMFINEQEFNPQIDEAYLLLGKARYYDQRFIPALEAFNYILQFMPESNMIHQALIWRERTNMRLDNNETAIKNIKKVLENDQLNIQNEDLAIANATLSQAFLNLEQQDSALFYMNHAANLTKDLKTIARYKFIAGQLFAKSGMRDSAYSKFDQIIEMHRKIPRRYYVHAFIEKIKLYNHQTDNSTTLIATLNQLEQNRENRPWLDHIYSRKAIYYDQIDSINKAKTYYNKSLRAKGGTDNYLRANNYDALGKISFDQNLYENAGKYYDSALALYIKRTPEHRLVNKKRNNLVDVIKYEKHRHYADSVFNILDMTPQQQIDYYNDYITDLKAQELELTKQAEVQALKEAQNQNAFQTIKNNQAKLSNSNAPSIGSISPPSGPTMGNTSFYFYNQQTVARGKIEFQNKWGKRKLQDNWRLSNQSTQQTGSESTDQTDTTESIEIKPEHTPQYYIDQLPQGKSILDSIAQTRDFAYYQLGVIYKEKFKRKDLAINRLERLITFKPQEKLLLPALYNLYLIYQDDTTTLNAKANSYKTRIINDFPNSRYAQLLLNPGQQLDDNSSPKTIYKKLYQAYQNEKFDLVIKNTEKYITLFNGDPIVPRLELLKAFASGRLYGFKAYKQGIDYVALNFANTEIGKQAQELMNKAESIKIPTEFIPDNDLKAFKLIYQITNNNKPAIDQLKQQLEQAIQQNQYDLKVSIDVYDTQHQLVVVHGLTSKLGAKGLGKLMADPNNGYNITHPYIAIATENYKIIQVHKNLDQYLLHNPK